MKDENQKKQKELIRLSFLLAVFFILVSLSKYFSPINYNFDYENLMWIAGFFLAYIAFRLFVISISPPILILILSILLFPKTRGTSVVLLIIILELLVVIMCAESAFARPKVVPALALPETL